MEAIWTRVQPQSRIMNCLSLSTTPDAIEKNTHPIRKLNRFIVSSLATEYVAAPSHSSPLHSNAFLLVLRSEGTTKMKKKRD